MNAIIVINTKNLTTEKSNKISISSKETRKLRQKLMLAPTNEEVRINFRSNLQKIHFF